MGAAAAEMEYGETTGNFDIIIVNDQLENAYIDLRNFILPEIEKLTRYLTCGAFGTKTPLPYALIDIFIFFMLLQCLVCVVLTAHCT